MNPNSCIRELWLYDIKSQEIMHDNLGNVEFLQHGMKRDKHLSERNAKWCNFIVVTKCNGQGKWEMHQRYWT